MKKYFLSILFLVPLPLLAFDLPSSTFSGVIGYLLSLINLLIPILSGLALIIFFYGLIRFVINAENDKALSQGKQYMLWGIIALFVLLSVGAILNLLSNELDLGGVNPTHLPLLPTNGQSPAVNSTLTFPGQN